MQYMFVRGIDKGWRDYLGFRRVLITLLSPGILERLGPSS